ncbi:MAG: hypothetical protein M3O70_03645 [Actinomycetota bacterium]|nr:hypothetical protein [Actinomycetota bacterium]
MNEDHNHEHEDEIGWRSWLERVMEPQVVDVIFIPGPTVEDETLDRLDAWMTEEPSPRGESPGWN